MISGVVPCSCSKATHAQHAHKVKHAGLSSFSCWRPCRKPVANIAFVAKLLHRLSSLMAAYRAPKATGATGCKRDAACEPAQSFNCVLCCMPMTTRFTRKILMIITTVAQQSLGDGPTILQLLQRLQCVDMLKAKRGTQHDMPVCCA